jgi:hypothetical protein
VRLRLLFPDSAAGALFLVFGVFTLALSDISIRAKSPTAGTKTEMAATFAVKPEAFMRPIISLIAEKATPHNAKFHLHYCAIWPQNQASGALFLGMALR